MMTQSTLAVGGFDTHSKVTRKAAFLARMDKLVPWIALEELIEPHYPKAGNGRPPREARKLNKRALFQFHKFHCRSVQFILVILASLHALAS